MKKLTCNIFLKAGILGLVLPAVFPSAAAQGLSGFDCLIEPNAVIEVGTSENGVLAELGVQRGDVIKKGQELARLESKVEQLAVQLARARAEMQAEVESSRMNVDYLDRQSKRIDEMVKKQALPSQEKDRAETELAAAADDDRGRGQVRIPLPGDRRRCTACTTSALPATSTNAIRYALRDPSAYFSSVKSVERTSSGSGGSSGIAWLRRIRSRRIRRRLA